jgi:hypothetical protein
LLWGVLARIGLYPHIHYGLRNFEKNLKKVWRMDEMYYIFGGWVGLSILDFDVIYKEKSS